jgi:hypothetical protein
MNPFEDIFNAQKALFATGVTRTYEWRVDQLDRMARMIRGHEERFQKAMAKDFKTASQEYIFETAASAGETEVQKSQLKEWMKPVEAPGAALPGRNQPQGDDLPRAVWRGADHRPVQRTPAFADPTGARGARGRQHLHSHAERSAHGDDRSAARSFRAP